MDADWYREMILERFKSPQHKGALESADHELDAVNPACGDDLKVYLEVRDGKITQAKFNGQGCAISQVATDLLLECLIGMTTEEAKQFPESKMYELLGGRVAPGREKCALLALNTIHAL